MDFTPPRRFERTNERMAGVTQEDEKKGAKEEESNEGATSESEARGVRYFSGINCNN